MTIDKDLCQVIDELEECNSDFEIYADGNVIVDNHDGTYCMYYVDAYNNVYCETISEEVKEYLFSKIIR